jgi:putative ABC transport system permease protein
MTDIPVPPIWGVALSALLVVLAGVIVVRQRLGLGRDLAEAGMRAAVQLVAVGFVLRVILEVGLGAALPWVAGMVVLGGWTAARRARELPGAFAAATVGIGCGTAASLGLLVSTGVIESEARIVLPLGGMVVSAAMQGCSICLMRLRDEATASRAFVEARLALGLSGPDAFAPHMRLALRSALSPAIDQTKIVGLISLPGAMTGLIIAGVSPLLAIRYQIVVMYMWLGASAISGLVAARLARRGLFDEGHRLRQLTAPGPRRRRAAA